ncbi:2-hydroxychromene-2-carboxylate isomerase [Hyphococcus sp.]|uniref:2-hydroxychromene-2-carboxylate isomerase n=1 Tax=Hyphococcus sp. TaxID=2038636 RepID=UPI003CCC1590
MPQPVEFWFDFASTYSYLTAVRIEEAAAAKNVSVSWRPILLGPIFALHGWNTSPFRVYPIKGEYMWRDVERRAEKLGRPFYKPGANDARDFPQHTVLAARMALIALDGDAGREFCKSVFIAEFEEGRDISDPQTLVDIAVKAGVPGDILGAATSPENKQRLRADVERAKALKIFGAPSFTVGEELFWGDDRLDDALDWAAR